MPRGYRKGSVQPATVALFFGWLLLLVQPSAAQDLAASIDLSGTVRVDEIDSATRTHLERAAAYLKEEQWDEAVETIRQVMESQGSRLVRLPDGRYLSARNYCHLQIASFPPAALELYRRRVDPLAERWYQQGKAARDAALLERVVREAFASSWGDDALQALGEIELERGHYGLAREYWERISPAFKTASGAPLWIEFNGVDFDAAWTKLSPSITAPQQPNNWVAYPDSSLNLAEVRARLVLVSILEGSFERADIELAIFRRLHPAVKGQFGGREVVLADALAVYRNAAGKWPTAATSTDWLTFGGAPERTKILSQRIDIAGPAWEKPIRLGQPLQADTMITRHFRLPQKRVAEEYDALLSYHPVVAGDLLLVNSQSKIWAYNVRTGLPAWGRVLIYSDDADRSDLEGTRLGMLGVPRFTMTVYGGKLFARMGSPITSRADSEAQLSSRSNYLVCRDLKAEGKGVWTAFPDDGRWAFEGTPVADGTNVYVVMRYSDVRPQVHVAAFDAQTGQRRWRRLICAAESITRGQVDEATHDLLALHDGALYLNTNLGAVAALDAADGEVRWVSLYSRAKPSDPALHFYRDLNPCVYYRGAVFVAPADTGSILAFDASSGALLWESPLADDVVHLLGVGADNLIASGNRLWWLNIHTGKVVYLVAAPKGHGRGLLAGSDVYWPTVNPALIMIFSQAITPGQGPQPRQPIALEQHVSSGVVKPGNLVVAGDLLLIVGPEEIAAFAPSSLPAGVVPH